MNNLQQISKALLLLLLIILGGRVEIPLGNVPFILSDLFVFSAAFLLNTRTFVIVILSFLGLGALGLPVFAGGEAGFKHLIGPTAGYLFGYLFGGMLVAFFKDKLKYNFTKLLLVFMAYYILFIFGVSGLVLLAELNLQTALREGFYPFIFSMHIKASLAWLFYLGVKKWAPIWLKSEQNNIIKQ